METDSRFSSQLIIGIDRLNKEKGSKSTTEIIEGGMSDIYHHHEELYSYLHMQSYDGQSIRFPAAFAYGAVEAYIVLPSYMTSESLTFDNVNVVHNTLMESIDGAKPQKPILYLDKMTDKVGRKWPEFPGWIEDEVKKINEIGGAEDLSTAEKIIAYNEFRAGALLVALTFLMREEARELERNLENFGKS